MKIPSAGETIGKGVGQVGTMLIALVAFHFWGWYGVAAYVALTIVVGLAAALGESAGKR